MRPRDPRSTHAHHYPSIADSLSSAVPERACACPSPVARCPQPPKRCAQVTPCPGGCVLCSPRIVKPCRMDANDFPGHLGHSRTKRPIPPASPMQLWRCVGRPVAHSNFWLTRGSVARGSKESSTFQKARRGR